MFIAQAVSEYSLFGAMDYSLLETPLLHSSIVASRLWKESRAMELAVWQIAGASLASCVVSSGFGTVNTTYCHTNETRLLNEST